MSTKISDTDELYNLLSNYEFIKSSEIKKSPRQIVINTQSNSSIKIDVEFNEITVKRNGKKIYGKEYTFIVLDIADAIIDSIMKHESK